MPRKMELGHNVHKSPLNELGIKGVGEAGALPPPPAFCQAVEDALYEYELDITESNLNPSLLYDYAKKAKKR